MRARLNLKGRRFGKWKVLGFAEVSKHRTMWRCRCVCGIEKEIRGSLLKSGASLSCSACSRKSRRLSITGKKFGRWLVLGFAGMGKHRTMWRCRCQCGTEKIVKGQNLSSGGSTKCQRCGRAKYPELQKYDSKVVEKFYMYRSNIKKNGCPVSFDNLEERFTKWLEAKKQKDQIQQQLRKLLAQAW